MFSIAVKYERIKFLVIALKNAVEIYAWAPKPYHKFMAFKVSRHVNYLTRACFCRFLSGNTALSYTETCTKFSI